MANKKLEERYESFLRYYKTFESGIERLNEREGTDYSPYSAPYTKEEYAFFYKALAQARKEEGKSAGNINRDLARDLMYDPRMSHATARAIVDYANKNGVVDMETGEIIKPKLKSSAQQLQKLRLQGREGELSKELFNAADEMYWSEIERLAGSKEKYYAMSKEERKKIVRSAKRKVSHYYWRSPE